MYRALISPYLRWERTTSDVFRFAMYQREKWLSRGGIVRIYPGKVIRYSWPYLPMQSVSGVLLLVMPVALYLSRRSLGKFRWLLFPGDHTVATLVRVKQYDPRNVASNLVGEGAAPFIALATTAEERRRGRRGCSGSRARGSGALGCHTLGSWGMAQAGGQLSSLTVFFPCHNEEENVVRVTEDALRMARRVSPDHEVIIVDDGSKDRTPALADELAAKYPGEVRAVHNVPNRGYGGALQRGFCEATKEWIFYTDGDGQFDVEEIDKLIPLLAEFDIASGIRLDRKDSWMRRMNAECWNWLVGVVLGLRIHDVDCAFKIYPRRFIESVTLRSEGALIDAEMLARATRAGYRIGQVGVHHYPRVAGESSGGNIRVILRAFRELLRLRRDILATPKAAAPCAHCDTP
ncbi:MAG TPA: glycosyltransferase family 2 protein [Phycisphaerae bacterium]|nr:glycosyltransferase family 2 protein [Phycisphaerae bacterium]